MIDRKTPPAPDVARRIGGVFFSPVFLARLFFVLLTVLCGVFLARPNEQIRILLLGIDLYIWERELYAIIALVGAIIITIVEFATDAISSHKLLMAVFGTTAGLIFSNLFYRTIPATVAEPASVLAVCNLLFGYFGAILSIKHAERFHLSRLKFFLSPQHERPKVLDSSVIIDGRIRELIDLSVVSGPIMVPDFVIREIQAIADSSEPNRKARGRRGLDVLEALRESSRQLELVEKDFPEVASVDQKLVHFCREMDGDLITNDYNLQKIAQLHRIQVININEIANALRPAVFIGEQLTLTIGREGKEYGQGVGYLEDGTMVVVDDANHMIGQEVVVNVSSILQTSSGRLVFARLRDREPQQQPIPINRAG